MNAFMKLACILGISLLFFEPMEDSAMAAMQYILTNTHMDSHLQVRFVYLLGQATTLLAEELL